MMDALTGEEAPIATATMIATENQSFTEVIITPSLGREEHVSCQTWKAIKIHML